jgi:hypothetical protein
MRIVASLLAIALAVCFSLSQTGCSPKPKETAADKDAFAADPATATLDKKDATKEIAFKKGDPDSAKPDDEKLVKAEVKEKKVVLTQIADSPAEDKTVKVKVLGGKEKKEETTITVTVSKKKAS